MSDTTLRKMGDRLVFSLLVVGSHVEAWVNRLNLLLMPRPRRHNGHERRSNPRACTLCGGPMRPDRRPPRDARGPDGKIRRLPEEVLRWFKCGRCHGSQVGVR